MNWYKNCQLVSQKPKYCKNFERNSHYRKLSTIMVWEHYCNASPKPEFSLFPLFIFSFISQLIWVRLGWNFHRWFSIQKQVNWCTIYPCSLKFCTSQHSYPVPLRKCILKSAISVEKYCVILLLFAAVLPFLVSILIGWYSRRVTNFSEWLTPDI